MSETPQAHGTIFAEPVSKANSRRMVPARSRTGSTYMRPIKSEKALAFESARMVIERHGHPAQPITGPVQVAVKCYYASRRPDLDPSLVLDALQRLGIIGNDRQVHDLHATKFLDAENPRAEFSVRQIPEPGAR